MKVEWKDCVNDPSEIGKKVLCERNGDFYVAIRLEAYYVPMPFADHYFCKDLCKPNRWCEISFPEPYTGYFRVIPEGVDSEMITLSEARKKHPSIYWKFYKLIIDSIGKIPKPEGMKYES